MGSRADNDDKMNCPYDKWVATNLCPATHAWPTVGLKAQVKALGDTLWYHYRTLHAHEIIWIRYYTDVEACLISVYRALLPRCIHQGTVVLGICSSTYPDFSDIRREKPVAFASIDSFGKDNEGLRHGFEKSHGELAKCEASRGDSCRRNDSRLLC